MAESVIDWARICFELSCFYGNMARVAERTKASQGYLNKLKNENVKKARYPECNWLTDLYKETFCIELPLKGIR